MASTRFTVNGGITVRRRRLCSGSSIMTKLSPELPKSFAKFGKPGVPGSELTLGSPSSARCSA